MTPSQAPIEVVELEDYTAVAADLGLRCSVSISRPLLDEVEALDALVRLRDVLLATTSDPAMEPIRAVALRGERPRPRITSAWYEAMKMFVARCRAGLGGVSEGGTMMALPLQGKRGLVMMICQLGFGIMWPDRNPRIVLTTADAASFYIEPIALRSLR